MSTVCQPLWQAAGIQLWTKEAEIPAPVKNALAQETDGRQHKQVRYMIHEMPINSEKKIKQEKITGNMWEICVGREYDISYRLISEGDPEKAAGVEMLGSSPPGKGKQKCKGPEAGECPWWGWKAEAWVEQGEGASLGLSAGVRLRGSVEKLGLRALGGEGWRAWDSSE